MFGMYPQCLGPFHAGGPVAAVHWGFFFGEGRLSDGDLRDVDRLSNPYQAVM